MILGRRIKGHRCAQNLMVGRKFVEMVKMHNNKHNKKTFDFKVGDVVLVLILSVDKGHCDNKRLPCIVKEAIKKANHILYILQCKFGILEQGYLAKEIEMYLGTLEMPQPSLRSIQSQVLDQLLILLQSIRLI